jgi:hypothetical protein
MTTTALLTGAAGKVGKYVIGALARRGIEVVASDIVSKGIPEDTRFEACDLTDAAAVRRPMSSLPLCLALRRSDLVLRATRFDARRIRAGLTTTTDCTSSRPRAGCSTRVCGSARCGWVP